MKKKIAIVLAAAMTMALAVPAFAHSHQVVVNKPAAEEEVAEEEEEVVETAAETEEVVVEETTEDVVEEVTEEEVVEEETAVEPIVTSPNKIKDREVVLEDGTAINPNLPYKWFIKFLERHNLPKITFHQLRHTNASIMIASGEDVVTVSGRLGHADKNITLNTYSHIIKSKETQVASKMDEFYEKLQAL